MLFLVYWEIDLSRLPEPMEKLDKMRFAPIKGLKEVAAYVMGSGRAFSDIEADTSLGEQKFLQP